MKIDGIKDVRDTALDIIAYEGIDKLTMSHLAESLGISKATLYHYYRSKDAILDDIYSNGHKALMKNGFRLNLDGDAESILLSAAGPWMTLFTSDDTVPYLRMVFSLHLTDEKAEEEYRALSLMLYSQAEVIIGAATKGKKAKDLLYASLFSSLLMNRLEKILCEEDVDIEKDLRDFARLISAH